MAQYIPDATTAYEPDLDNLVLAMKGNSILSGGAVAAQGSPNMTVQVATGFAKWNGAAVTIPSTASLTISAADPTNPRVDLVTVSSSGTVVATAGTPSSSPKPPSLPANTILLALVSVAAAAANIQNSNISDRRITLADGILQGTTAARPGATLVPAGTVYFSSDELSVYRSNATVWTSFTGGGVASVSATGAMTADFSTGLTKEWGSTGNITGITLSNGGPHQWHSIVIKYGGTHTVVFTTTVLWANGTTPTFTSVNTKYDVISLYYDGTNWLGEFSGNH